jgi:hypothetical protein
MEAAKTPARSEWAALDALLPHGWRESSRTTGAIKRARYITDPEQLLRLLLFHAISGGSMRETVARAEAAGLVSITSIALLKRLRTSGAWLEWIARELCHQLCRPCRTPEAWRVRIVDATTVQGPMSRGIDWRLHYSLDLRSCTCDWFELTDGREAELLQRTPVSAGDIMIGDRGYSRPKAVLYAVEHGAHVLLRLRWSHTSMLCPEGKIFKALEASSTLKVGDCGDWPVSMLVDGHSISGRVVSVKLSAPVASKRQEKLRRGARKKGKKLNPQTLEAANYVMLFTTVPLSVLAAKEVAELYRCRWQVELAFKRHKQLLQVGHVPHNDHEAARTWILAKLVMALLLEKLYRMARDFSPWGYDLATIARTQA